MNKLEEGADTNQVYGMMPAGLAVLGALTLLASGSLLLALFWVFAEKRSNLATALAVVGVPTLTFAAVLAAPMILRSWHERISDGHAIAVLFAALALALSQVLALGVPRAFGLLPLVLLNCGGFYVGCRMARLKSIRHGATWLVTIVTLATLGFASLWMSLVWVAAEGPGDRESVHAFWPPTIVAVWFLGSAALLIGGRGQLLLRYFGICLGVLIVFALALEAALYMPIPFGLIAFLGLNIAAVSLAWSSFLESLHENC